MSTITLDEALVWLAKERDIADEWASAIGRVSPSGNASKATRGYCDVVLNALRWRDASEKPEPETPVLGCFDGGDSYSVVKRNGRDWFAERIEQGDWTFCLAPTHWLPIPQPPAPKTESEVK